MDRDDILAYLLFIILPFSLVLSIPFIYIFSHPECHSSNPELLDKIIEYGDKIDVWVCDMSTCVYVCEEMKKEYNFTDDCKDVCIPSECFGGVIW